MIVKLRKVALATMVVFGCFEAPAAEPLAVQWKERIAESSAALKARDHGKSLKISESVISQMKSVLGPGDAATEVFSIVLTHKALALAGLGRQDEALWWWHAALSMHPGMAKADLSEFHEAGQFLASRRERGALGGGQKPKNPNPGIQAPRVKKKVAPDFPGGAQYFGIAGMLVMEVVIAKDGTPRSPKILQNLPAPTLSYAALDAVRRWRFEPGKVDGEPADVVFKLTINYKP
jgi:TonB family protein